MPISIPFYGARGGMPPALLDINMGITSYSQVASWDVLSEIYNYYEDTYYISWLTQMDFSQDMGLRVNENVTISNSDEPFFNGKTVSYIGYDSNFERYIFSNVSTSQTYGASQGTISYAFPRISSIAGLSQSTNKLQPRLNIGMQFDGSDDVLPCNLTLTQSTGWTMLIDYTTDVSAYRYLFGSSSHGIRNNINGDSNAYNLSTTAGWKTFTYARPNGRRLVFFRGDANNIHSRIHTGAQATVSGASGDMTITTIGTQAANYAAFNLYRLAFWNKRLSDAQINKLGQEQAAKTTFGNISWTNI